METHFQSSAIICSTPTNPWGRRPAANCTRGGRPSSAPLPLICEYSYGCLGIGHMSSADQSWFPMIGYVFPPLGGALAGKWNLIYTLGQNPAAEKNVDTSRFWVIFENSPNCGQIICTSCRSIFHAPKSSQMACTAKIKKITNFTNKIQNPLGLRLVLYMFLDV